MKKWCRKWFKGTLIVLWALAFTQGPAFIDQYRDHLTGHVEELRYQLDLLKEIKDESGEESAFSIFAKKMNERYQTMSREKQDLAKTSPWLLPFIFVRQMDYGIASETYAMFTYSVPATWDGLIYGVLGAIVGYLIFLLIFSISRGVKNLFRKEDKEGTKPE